MGANKLEVTLGFKPLFEGLNRWVSGTINGVNRIGDVVRSRMQLVAAFNKRIENGSQATNALLQQGAAALGGLGIAALFSRTIKSGVEFNAQLEQAELGIAAVLKQFDSVGQFKTFDDALKASASAIELLKQKAKESPASFSDLVQAFQGTAGAMASANIPLQKQVDLIVTMSQTLAGLGIRSDQILQETRALLTGNINADAQAAKILEITSADIAQAKQQGQLYEFLAGKVASFGEAARRGAGSLATLRSNFGDALEQRAAKSVERLNEALKRLYTRLTELVDSPAVSTLMGLAGDKLGGLVDGVTALVAWLSDLGPASQQALLSLADSAAKLSLVFVPLLAFFVLLRGAWLGLLTLANPLRVAIVGFAGVNFAGALLDLQLFSRELGLLSTVKLATWGQRWIGFLGIVGAGLAGWQLGSFINELEVGGAKVKEWAALVANSLFGLLQALDAWADVLARKAAAGATEAMAKLKELYWRGALSIVEALNTVLARFGKTIPTDALKQAIVEARAEIALLKADNAAAVAAAEAALARIVTFRGDVGDALADDAFGVPAPELVDRTKPEAAAAATPGKTKEAKAAELEELKAALELERLHLEQSYELKNIELDAYLAKRYDLLEQAIEAERKLSEKPPGRAAVALVLAQEAAAQAKIVRETQQKRRDTVEKEKQLKLAEEEQTLSEKLGELAQRRAEIEGDLYSTAEEKRPKLLKLLQDENRLLDDKIKKLDDIITREIDAEKRLQLRQEREAAARQRADNTQQQAGMEPQTIREGIAQGAINFLDQIGTAAENAAEAVTSVLNTALQSTSDLLYNLATGSMTFREAWNQAILQVGQSFLRGVTDMVAKMIWRATVEKLLIVTGVAAHITGEAAKTGATATGATARKGINLGETIFLGGQWAIRTATHLAGEAASTAVTLAQKAIRLPFIIAETAAYLAKAAIAAASAVASIPVVGPILAIAAMGAIVGAGAKLIAGREHGGDVRAGTPYVVGEKRPEVFVPDQDGYIYPNVASGLAALSGNVTAGMASPPASGGAAAGGGGGGASAAGSGPDMEEIAQRITVIQVSSPREATRIARQSRARGDITRIVEEDFGIPRRRA